jgi:hypothetical protein
MMGDNTKQAGTLAVGVAGGTAIGLLLGRRPAGAAGEDLGPKLDYIADLLEQVVTDNAQMIALLQQLLSKPIEIGASVLTPWVSKEPEHIFEQAIRAVGVQFSDSMVDFHNGKRLLIKVESSLDQPVVIQLIGNIANTRQLAANIGGPFACPANANIDIGLAWGDWHPFVGVQITSALAPASGLLNIWAVVQE